MKCGQNVNFNLILDYFEENRKEIIELLRMFRVYLSFDKSDEAKIREFLEEISNHKVDGVYDSKCHHKNDETEKFCSSCGIKLPVQSLFKPKSGIFCAFCNSVNRIDAKFCYNCGHKMNEIVSKVSSEPVIFKYGKCPKCKSETKISFNFCENCGYYLCDKQTFLEMNKIKCFNVILFFLTNKFIQSDKFREEWNGREKKIILIILLESFNSSSNLDLSNFFVSEFNNLMSLVRREEAINRNRIFLSRLQSFPRTNIRIVYDDSLTSKLFECRIKYEELGNGTEKIQIIGENEIILQNFDR
jgi:hypothetical protein